jgi:hypothetical protein
LIYFPDLSLLLDFPLDALGEKAQADEVKDERIQRLRGSGSRGGDVQDDLVVMDSGGDRR